MGLATLDKAVRPDSTVREDAPALAAVAAGSAAVVAAEAAAVVRKQDGGIDMRKRTNSDYAGRRSIRILSLAVLLTLLVPVAMLASVAQATPQKTFRSPAQAVEALYTAAKMNNSAELTQIFGPQAKDLLSSGDPVSDKADRERVVKKYDEMHRLVTEPDKSVRLYLGAENWPFPIPLVNKGGAWSFDTKAGKEEILYRRIGRNEHATIDTLGDLVKAQKEYASVLRDGSSVKQYAQKLLSDDGKHNGLYWKTAKGEPQSPIGPLVASASAAGYKKGKEGPTPFHGYIYRILEGQGKDAPGGAMSYMSNGMMTRGFAIVAYPATYRNSGVMTFIVNQDGNIYQKDLGTRTEAIAAAMKEYNPDKTWSPAE